MLSRTASLSHNAYGVSRRRLVHRTVRVCSPSQTLSSTMTGLPGPAATWLTFRSLYLRRSHCRPLREASIMTLPAGALVFPWGALNRNLPHKKRELEPPATTAARSRKANGRIIGGNAILHYSLAAGSFKPLLGSSLLALVLGGRVAARPPASPPRE